MFLYELPTVESDIVLFDLDHVSSIKIEQTVIETTTQEFVIRVHMKDGSGNVSKRLTKEEVDTWMMQFRQVCNIRGI